MLHSLCGEENLENVRIITTNWSRVNEQEGNRRETDLKHGAFKALLDAGAQMRRHTNTVDSAHQIMSELIFLEAVTMQVQKELDVGKKLVNTSVGRVLMEEMREMEKRHEREMAGLKQEMESAAQANDHALRVALEQEHRILEGKIERVSADQEKLGRTLEELRRARDSRWQQERALFMLLMTQLICERREMLAHLARADKYQLLLTEWQTAGANGPVQRTFGENVC